VPAYTIWQLTDDMSNGRWLFVDHPPDDGEIPVGIQRVYTKYLDSAEARAMAAALIQAADELDNRPPPKPPEIVHRTSGYTFGPVPFAQWNSALVKAVFGNRAELVTDDPDHPTP
jgi:hypothetical protein